jgi:hypothetical protein
MSDLPEDDSSEHGMEQLTEHREYQAAGVAAPSEQQAHAARCAVSPGSAVCSMCGTPWQGLLCLDCCAKKRPAGPPLKRLRRYGFQIAYHQRREMRLASQISGAIPTDCDPVTRAVKMSHRYVACDGKTYVTHEWIYPLGSSVSSGEPYPPNRRGKAQGDNL